jgi:hypothetical protein
LPAVLALAALLQAAPAAAQTGPGRYQVGPGPASTEEGVAPAGYILVPETPPVVRVEPTGVTIDQYDPRRAEGDRTPEDDAYAAVVRGGAMIAQGRQGPLDGAWTLVAADGARLYDFQLVDTGESLNAEGAWRKAESARRSGFMLVAREAGRTTLRFFEPGGSSPILIELEPLMDGSWRGRLLRGEAETPVTMRRR